MCVYVNAVKWHVILSAVSNSYLYSVIENLLTRIAIMERFTVKQMERVQADNTVCLNFHYPFL
jgi:hypothetical protein